MTNRKRGLGRGLDALLGHSEPETDQSAALREIPVEFIHPGKYQPRHEMDSETLSDLAESIKTQGVIQPIVVRTVSSDNYEIIAGERRWRATQLAGLDNIPAIVRDVSDESAVAMSLIENIQREDLNPMEEAAALQRLQDEFHLTHQQMAEAVGKNRTTVTNFLRLMNLSAPIAALLEKGELEMGHARALLTLTDEQQNLVAKDVVSKGLNVRQTESLVRRLVAGQKGSQRAHRVDVDTRQLEDRISDQLAQPVSIHHTAKGKGRLTIKYNSLDELDGILAHLIGSDNPER
jgi:ParB family chromosome partitioning protein|tara:strand:- start:734 stop:1606 length:873 start_codon:yes stop_codon:yes gene_type:complete